MDPPQGSISYTIGVFSGSRIGASCFWILLGLFQLPICATVKIPHRVDSKQLEYGYGMIYSGFHSSRGFRGWRTAKFQLSCFFGRGFYRDHTGSANVAISILLLVTNARYGCVCKLGRFLWVSPQ